MNLLGMLLILVLATLVWLFIRHRRSDDTSESKPTVRTSSKGSEYHAVSIRYDTNACKAAREMQGRRFLSTAAPRLPLARCDVLECNCRFTHHTDRRSGIDRRSPFGPGGIGSSSGAFESEQREGNDRRKSDDESD